MRVRKFLLFFCLLITATSAHAATEPPTIDFGTVYYCPDGEGAQTVAVSDASAVTTKGTGGGIDSQSGGAAGVYEGHYNMTVTY